MTMTVSLRGKNVVMSNAISRAAQSLSLAEKRIIFAAIAQMGGKYAPVRITAQEYANTFGMPIKQAYSQLKEASENFFNRYIRFKLNEVSEIDVDVWKIRWLGAYKYNDGEANVLLHFTPQVMPYLCELEDNFTKYQLSQACALRSVHSWRLLELFEQMNTNKENNGWLSISLEDFHHAMESPDSYKTTFGLLRKYMIEPAVKELTEKDHWMIDWKPIKKGRKVVRLEFWFRKEN
ncbi:replication initiation protein [Escherichia coli]|nr:replication initiation protein [Salmonella enterica]EBV7576237.1 RepB family plasmid replication initiator protein [Salmonella enterica subsp. enterica serovar Ohio]ECC8725658.1 replication initiation protein [Salmonella enterica subsp. enterica]EDB4947336.1 replication initiation protein [Salmonella enterica subsp. enterica serovar Enteritidis]EDQ2684868.1 replication initiation protein [Salmonella enterica subsp. enterica serovar Thompson]EDS5529953.1 replication initiation protein [Salmo